MCVSGGWGGGREWVVGGGGGGGCGIEESVRVGELVVVEYWIVDSVWGLFYKFVVLS